MPVITELTHIYALLTQTYDIALARQTKSRSHHSLLPNQ